MAGRIGNKGKRRLYDDQSYYVCGQCNTKIYHLKTEEPHVPCPECDWFHKDKKKYKLPSFIKLDLTRY